MSRERLSARQEAFCLEYSTNGGYGTAAYTVAYRPKDATTAAACASKLLRNAKVIRRIRELQDATAAPKITTLTQVKAFWSTVIQDPDEKTSDRLRASELYAKAAGAFLHFRPDPDDPGRYGFAESDGEDVVIYLPQLDPAEECELDEPDDDEIEGFVMQEGKRP